MKSRQKIKAFKLVGVYDRREEVQWQTDSVFLSKTSES